LIQQQRQLSKIFMKKQLLVTLGIKIISLLLTEKKSYGIKQIKPEKN